MNDQRRISAALRATQPSLDDIAEEAIDFFDGLGRPSREFRVGHLKTLLLAAEQRGVEGSARWDDEAAARWASGLALAQRISQQASEQRLCVESVLGP